MAGENTQSTFDAYKERYAQGGPQNLIPNSAILRRMFSLESELTGDSYHQAVTMTLEHGFTHGGSGGAVSTMVTQVAANIYDANSTGYSITGKARIGYTAASRAASSAQAFGKLWDQVLSNLKLGHEKRHELALLRGQMALGKVSANAAGVLTITDDSWSPTTWAGMDGATIQAFDSLSATATQDDGDLVITGVDFVNKTVTVTGSTAATDSNSYLWLKGVRTATAFNEGPGLVKIAGNAGTLFGIDSTAANRSLWKGNTKTSFTTPSMGKYLAEIVQCVDKGLEEKVYLLIPTKAWEHLNADLHQNRELDGSYSKEKAENGAQKISYYGQAGEIEVRAHPYLQRGESVAFPKSPYKRIGSADVAFGVPGLPDSNNIFFHDTTTDAMEARSFSDASLFCSRPGTSLYISGVTYP